jgi:hypothetical protein
MPLALSALSPEGALVMNPVEPLSRSFLRQSAVDAYSWLHLFDGLWLSAIFLS